MPELKINHVLGWLHSDFGESVKKDVDIFVNKTFFKYEGQRSSRVRKSNQGLHMNHHIKMLIDIAAKVPLTFIWYQIFIDIEFLHNLVCYMIHMQV